MGQQDQIVDAVNYRARASSEIAESGAISQQNIDGVMTFVDDQGNTTTVGGSYSGLISGGTNGTQLANAINQANMLGGAVTIQLGKGTYNITAQQIANADGITIVGNGPGSTFLQLDDAGGLGGADAFVLNSHLWFKMTGLTFSATSPRTAGAAVKVLGANNITATPAQRTRQLTLIDVDMQDQFNGVVTNDGSGSAGAWGSYISRGEWIRFNTGGVAVWINSPSGGQQFISDMKFYNGSTTADASRALAAVRYQGGNDLEISNINSIYFQHGLMIDPPNGQDANVTIARGCEWDNNTQASILIAPQSGGSVLDVTAIGNWGYTPPSNAKPCVQIDGGTNIQILGGQYESNYQAIRIFGPAKYVSVIGIDASASIAGIYVSNSATDFILKGNTVGSIGAVVPTSGIQVDSGCDHYVITDNNLRAATTPLTNTPNTATNQRIVANNILV